MDTLLTDYYLSTYINANYYNIATIDNNYYTKNEIDTNNYTKTETDTLLDTKQDTSDGLTNLSATALCQYSGHLTITEIQVFRGYSFRRSG